jgi:hypothetical protein
MVSRVRGENSMAYQQASLRVKTGKISGLAGNKNRITGKIGADYTIFARH